MYADIHCRSFLASDNDMNLLIRGVRFTMRVARAEHGKGVFDLKADSTDTEDFFYMGDADPDRVRTT
jgi:choline dehydrogenase